MEKRKLVLCLNCSQRLNLPAGKLGIVRCNACLQSFEADTRETGVNDTNILNSVAGHLFGGVFGFLDLFKDFIKSPVSFHLISITDATLKKAAALYLAAGVITFFSLNQVNKRFEVIFGEPAPLASMYGATTTPVLGEFIQAVYGLLFLITLIPAAFILKTKNSERKFKEIMLFFFSMGSVGAFVYSLGVFIGSLFGISANTADDLIMAYTLTAFIPSVAVIIFIPFYFINLKRFSNRGWGRIFSAFAVSFISAIPFQMLIAGVFFFLS